MRVRLLVLLFALTAPSLAAAEAPAAASRLWTEAYGDIGLSKFEMPDVTEGEPVTGTLWFDPTYEVTDVAYQVCEVGQSCFAIGVPLRPQGDGVWALSTDDVEAFVGRPAPSFAAGDRIGIQLFITRASTNTTEGYDPLPAVDCDPFLPDHEWDLCQEQHYFITTILPGAKDTPGIGPAALLLGLASVVALTRRWNA